VQYLEGLVEWYARMPFRFFERFPVWVFQFEVPQSVLETVERAALVHYLECKRKLRNSAYMLLSFALAPFSPTPHDLFVVNVVVGEDPGAELVSPHNGILGEAILLRVDLNVLLVRLGAEFRILEELGGLHGGGAIHTHGERVGLGYVGVNIRCGGRNVQVSSGDVKAAPDGAFVEDSGGERRKSEKR
jgi:hypothetical protein